MPSSTALELTRLIKAGVVEIIGPIRQEVLSGVRDHSHFEKLKARLGSFADLPVTTSDYEDAAGLYNICMSKGVKGTGTDMLICAVAMREDIPVYTLDADFVYYAKALPLKLHIVRA